MLECADYQLGVKLSLGKVSPGSHGPSPLHIRSCFSRHLKNTCFAWRMSSITYLRSDFWFKVPPA